MPRIRSEDLGAVPAGMYPYRTVLVLDDGREFIIQDFVKDGDYWEAARNRVAKVRVFISESGERFRYVFKPGERREMAMRETTVQRQLESAIAAVTARHWRSKKQPIVWSAGSRRYFTDVDHRIWRVVDYDHLPLDLYKLDRVVENAPFRYFIRDGEPLTIRCYDRRGHEDEKDNGDALQRQLARAQIYDYGEAWMKTQ